ncbi:hypothetical protein P691DRAFT_808795 [Macrolepiota fuliginosa MF-IS2]|uniref:DUF5648 domain-containing protein n=1 Tax=Macrolepiota fuliginosa MF-IS2 TaxID=1400762 RepID=A0A9P5X5G3_9AGAR|nr:hypothetical protein P691DRAFT_808795 [Macrolepiota fuliginosa MF-IS2]
MQTPPYPAGGKCSSGSRCPPYGCPTESCYGARTVTVTATSTVTVHSRPTSSSVCASPSETVTLRRIWNPVWQDHFYTTDSREAAYSGSHSEITEEASPGSIFLTQVAGTVPLWRCYWSTDGKYDHFYTADKTEFQSAQLRGCTEYPDRASVGYLYPTGRCGTIALYRLFNHQQKDHLYTSDLAERNDLLGSGTYEDEGVTGYILPHTTI